MNDDLISSISHNSFSINKLLSSEDKRAINKCITEYESIVGDTIVQFSDFEKEILTAKEFIEKNEKYSDIPLASKIYLYRYKNKDAMFIIVHKDGKKIQIIDCKIMGNLTSEKAYYITSMCVNIGVSHPYIKTFLNSFSKKKLESDRFIKDAKKDAIKSESVLYFDDLITEGVNFDATREIIKPLKDTVKCIVKIQSLIRNKKYDIARNMISEALNNIKTAKDNVRKLRDDDDGKNSVIIGNVFGILLNVFYFLSMWKVSVKKNNIPESKFKKFKTKLRHAIAILSTASTVYSDIKQLKEEYDKQDDNKKINLYIAKIIKCISSLEVQVKSLESFVDFEEEVDKALEEIESN